MLNLFRRHPPEVSDTPLPSFERPAQRVVFRYWDGCSDRYADPLMTLRRLDATDLRLDSDPGATDEGDPEATARMVTAAREVFHLEPYRETEGQPRGLTDAEALELLVTFGHFIQALKKNTEPPPT